MQDQPATRSLAEILGVRLLLVNVLRPLAAGQRLTPEAFDRLLDEISNAKHQLAGKLAIFGRKEIGNGNDKVGTQGNDYLATAQPDIYVWGAVHDGRFDRAFSLLPVRLRQQPPTAFLYSDLHPIECCGRNRSDPQRQLPDAHGGRSWNSTATGDGRRRDRRKDARTGQQADPACAVATRPCSTAMSCFTKDRAEGYIDASLNAYLKSAVYGGDSLFDLLQAPTIVRTALTDHSAPIFDHQGCATAEATEVRKTTKRPRADDAEAVQRRGPRRWNRH